MGRGSGKRFVRRKKEEIVPQEQDEKGAFVQLIKGKERHKCYVADLVLQTFVGECPEGCEAKHKDGDLNNNHLDNLYWGPIDKET